MYEYAPAKAAGADDVVISSIIMVKAELEVRGGGDYFRAVYEASQMSLPDDKRVGRFGCESRLNKLNKASVGRDM